MNKARAGEIASHLQEDALGVPQVAFPVVLALTVGTVTSNHHKAWRYGDPLK
jgi:hypothetical protein